MAYGNRESNYKRNANNAKKADIILETDREISAKVDAISARLELNNKRMEAALTKLGQLNGAEAPLSELYNTLHGEYTAIKREMRYLAAQNEHIFLTLSEKLQQLTEAVEKGVPAQTAQPEQSVQTERLAMPVPVVAQAEIDYNELAQKVAELLPAQEYISADYIASKVAEQIMLPEAVNSASLHAAEEKQTYNSAVAPVAVDLQLNEDELADRIALKVGGIKADDFDILVDDDGCASISETIVEKLDYETISTAIAEKLRTELAFLAGEQPDYEEMAARISEKITVAGINEEAIAEKAAAVIAGYVPEVDTDEIADKVVAQIFDNMPVESADSEEVAEEVTEEVGGPCDSRLDEIEKQLKEIKAMLIGGVVLSQTTRSEEEYEEPYVVEESSLVTVSDVTENEEDVEPNEELEELVEELDEVPAEGEVMLSDLDLDGGVDFLNMMKYNRSFIARIIQSTDEQKEYYGRVKTALLSYAKVNSNIAWGAERFNKGRETIARFKIRGKTLCLYLALNPTDYQYSVYHHIDVSGNKSMHGTPMMIKIKSPRGVKKAIRLIDELLAQRGGVKRTKSFERNYAAMYPYETMEELISDGLVKDVSKNK